MKGVAMSEKEIRELLELIDAAQTNADLDALIQAMEDVYEMEV